MTMTGMIYKIEINENDIYVGSTTLKLCFRQSKHNYDKTRYPERKLYKSCIENNINYIKCIWVADCEYNSIEELRMIEESYRKLLNGNLNTRKCYSSEEDKKKYLKNYYDENKSKMDEYQKVYDKKNKEKISERKKKYREENKDKIKETSKKYREENKDKRKEYDKKYRENNKKKISEKSKEKITCEKCNSIVRKTDISRHHKSKKCILLSECIFSDDD
tara:strand:+ start:57 stop:713 length:657 start_codon:yes stop_codon:yes gene_type:complete